ncbi:MAG TPA: MFS transporter [Bryobacteraceae bacterium]|nr:MFS transporter [Bryobacteraceae bacterium]
MEKSPRYRGWRVTLASSACVFVGFASLLVYTFGVFLKPLANEFGWSREAVSAAFGLAALSVAACSPALGYLLDRYPARRIILPCLTIFGLAFALLSKLSPPIWHLYAIFIILGIVGNGTAHLAFTRVISTWFDERRGLAFSVLLTGGAIGAMVLPSVAQSLISTVGWRTTFMILGAMSLVAGLPLATRVRENPAQLEAASSTPGSGSTTAEGLRSYIFWIIVVVLFLASVSQNGAIAHLSALLTDRGVSPEKAALALSALGGATVLGRLVTGGLLDRFFAPRVGFALLGIAAIGTALLANARSLSTGVIAAALIGVGMGGEADVTPYLLTKYFGLRSFSTLYGFTWTAYAIAGALGPVIMGKAFDATGSYSRLLVYLGVSTLIAAVLMLFLPRYRISVRHADIELSTAEAREII